MNKQANDALAKLLASAERAWAKTGTANASLKFSHASNPAYFEISSSADKKACHAVLLHAEHKGAISIEWDPAAGYQNQIARIRLKEADILASLLGIVPRWTAVEKSTAALGALRTGYPIIDSVLNAWRLGKRPRGLTMQDAPRLLDAAKTIQARRQTDRGSDISVRRLSAQLGFDSKRIEALAPALDLLTASDLDQPAREPEEFFSELGIVKHPMPVLLSGPAVLTLDDEPPLSLPKPYIGIDPDSVVAIEFKATFKTVLSVENLTTFHELAALKSKSVLLVYSNGMPSPSWRRFYRRMLEQLPSHSRLFHWGDIDAGGYRIAAKIAEVCREQNRLLELHMMNPEKLPKELCRRSLLEQEVRQMQRIAQKMGWMDLAEAVLAQPNAYEQEALELALPQ